MTQAMFLGRMVTTNEDLQALLQHFPRYRDCRAGGEELLREKTKILLEPGVDFSALVY